MSLRSSLRRTVAPLRAAVGAPDGVPDSAADQPMIGRSRIGWLFAGVWLIYLLAPLSAMDDAGPWRKALGYAALGAFVVVFMLGIGAGRRLRAHGGSWPMWRRWSILLGLVALMLAMIPAAGDTALVAAAFVSAFAAASLPVRPAVAVVVALVVTTELAVRVVDGWSDHGIGLGVVLAAVAAGSFRLAFERNQALLAARERLADAAVEDERSRIARDLHDILGHSLTVIAVKTELARRLIDVDVERARKELDDLEKLSRDALADVRATAMGVRGVSLVGEIAAARQALQTADIEADLPTAVDDVPTQWREVFAWAVRECVTNVIRHSHATTCLVEVAPTRLRILDDGVGLPAGGPPPGHGLDGLRQRVELAGASMTAGAPAGGRGLEVVVAAPS